MKVTVDLSTHAWRPASQSWWVDVLRLPEARLHAVLVDGVELASARYRVDGTELRLEGEQPGSLQVRVELRRRFPPAFSLGMCAIGLTTGLFASTIHPGLFSRAETSRRPPQRTTSHRHLCARDLRRLLVLSGQSNGVGAGPVERLTSACLDLVDQAKEGVP